MSRLLSRLRRLLSPSRPSPLAAQGDGTVVPPHQPARDDLESNDRVGSAEEALVSIDDIVVRKRADHVELDIRVRNAGRATANVTRAEIDVLDRLPAAAVYKPSGFYEILIDGDHNEVAVAHVLGPGEVDRFVLRLGFSKYNTQCWFKATLSLTYNGDERSTSRAFAFESTFD